MSDKHPLMDWAQSVDSRLTEMEAIGVARSTMNEIVNSRLTGIEEELAFIRNLLWLQAREGGLSKKPADYEPVRLFSDPGNSLKSRVKTTSKSSRRSKTRPNEVGMSYTMRKDGRHGVVFAFGRQVIADLGWKPGDHINYTLEGNRVRCFRSPVGRVLVSNDKNKNNVLFVEFSRDWWKGNLPNYMIHRTKVDYIKDSDTIEVEILPDVAQA